MSDGASRRQSARFGGLLPVLPEEWRYFPLKRMLARNDGGAWGSDPTGVGDTIVLRSTEQTVDGRWSISEPAVRQLSEHEALATRLEAGDLLVTKSSGSSLHIGKTTLVDEEVAALRAGYSNFMQRLRTKPELLPRFCWYFLNSEVARTQLAVTSTSSTGLANLTASLLGSLLAPTAPVPVQEVLLGILDRETAKIDDLIADQERLIALLREKRQAVISNAVTKGLDPNVPMKESGVEWIGRMPAHWSLVRVRDVARVRNGAPFDSSLFDGSPDGWPLIRIRDIGSDMAAVRYLGEWDDRYAISTSDVLVGMDGDFSVGRWRSREAGLLNQRVCALSTPDHTVSSLLEYTLAIPLQLINDLTYATTVKHLSSSQVETIALPMPPDRAELEGIVAYVGAQTATIDQLADQALALSRLLRERRTALITAAVTGQIDVRGLVEAAA